MVYDELKLYPTPLVKPYELEAALYVCAANNLKCFASKLPLYVVEVKNYKGMIFGNEENLNWTVTVKHVNKKKGRNGKVYKKTNISKHKFYNPIIQNKTHINKIKNLTNIHDDIPVYNIVVFGKNSIIRDVTLTGTAMVVHQSKLKMLITALENNVNLSLIHI